MKRFKKRKMSIYEKQLMSFRSYVGHADAGHTIRAFYYKCLNNYYSKLESKESEYDNFVITVATPEEKLALVPHKYWNSTCITGIGTINTLNTLGNLENHMNKRTTVINVGFAGANCVPIGTVCRVHTVGEFNEHHLSTGESKLKLSSHSLTDSYTCLSSSDFVTKVNTDEKFLVDMELANYVCLSQNVYSIKVVSDNFNMEGYNDALKKDYTEAVEREIKAILKDK